jgi:Tfp pilus assembly protein PilX
MRGWRGAMEQRKNEKGYALLIVLFFVVFIMIVSALFMRGSISNAKQERIVDNNNLAYNAAEMGVDYYVHKIGNIEKAVRKEVKELVKQQLDLYLACSGSKDSNVPGCTNVKTIEDIKTLANSTYYSNLTSKIESITGSQTKKTIIDNLKTYELVSLTPKNSNTNDTIQIELNIKGSSTPENNKTLKANINYKIKGFVEAKEQSGQIGQVTNPDDIFSDFSLNNNYKQEAACSAKNGHCQSGKFYSEGKKTANNPNKQSGLIWVHNGLLQAGNMNSMAFTLIVKSLDGKNMNSMNGNLVLLGGKNRSGEITSGISMKLDSKGKVCINIDGYPKEHIEKITFDKPNQVLFYSGVSNPVWPNNASSTSTKTGPLNDFVKECTGIEIISPPLQSGIQYQVKLDSVDVVVDVNY